MARSSSSLVCGPKRAADPDRLRSGDLICIVARRALSRMGREIVNNVWGNGEERTSRTLLHPPHPVSEVSFLVSDPLSERGVEMEGNA